MPKFLVRLYVERIVEAYVEAKNEKEAKLKAFSWDNLIDETTDMETIKDVEVVKP